MEAFSALRRTPSVLWRSPSVVVVGVAVAALVGAEARVEPSGVTRTAFEVVYVLISAFVLGGVYGTVSEAVESGQGEVSDFLSSAVSNFPALAAGFLLLYVFYQAPLWLGQRLLEVVHEGFEASAYVGFSIVFLSMSLSVSLAFVTAAVVLFVFQFFGVAVVSREGRGVIEDIVSSLLDSARFVNDNLGSVVEFVFVSVALLAVLAVVFVFIPVIGVFLISSEKSAMGLVTSLEALPVLTAAVFSVLFYTYQTVYYHSLKSS